MSKLTLYEFPHSHYCEVARWALEYKGLAYKAHCLLPGFHAVQMKRLAGASSLPVLRDDDRIIQGSGAIVDHLDQYYPQRPLTPTTDVATVHEFEAEVSRDIGVPLRRLCYYHLMPRPELVRYFFMHRSSPVAGWVFRFMYPLLSRRLRDTYDCTADGAATACAALTSAIARFDQRLADREYFFDDKFSRADLTFAALLVFMVMPAEYPVNWPPELTDHELGRWFANFGTTASYQHVSRIYANYRLPA